MIDDLDRRLISLLRSNARTPVAALARDLGVNRSTVTARIDALTGSGVIEAFTIRLSDEVDRDAIRAVALVLSEPKFGQEVVRAVRGFPEVERLHSTLGSWDLVVQLRRRRWQPSTPRSSESAQSTASRTRRRTCWSTPSPADEHASN